MAVTLSKRQIGDADRVGGIELMILWPEALGPEPDVRLDHEAEATPTEKTHAESLVRDTCAANGLVPVHTRVTCVRRPGDLPGGGGPRVHLAVTIIGHRWVHAKGARRGRVAFAKET